MSTTKNQKKKTLAAKLTDLWPLRIKMGMAGLIFEPRPPNFEKFYKDVQMMLTIFFDIPTGFRFSKISEECSVHLCSCPCLTSLDTRL